MICKKRSDDDFGGHFAYLGVNRRKFYTTYLYMLTAAQFEELGETLVDRAGIAKLLKISPNRVSELVRLGVFSPCTDDRKLFPYPHCNSCYQDYRDWYTNMRQPGDRYADID